MEKPKAFISAIDKAKEYKEVFEMFDEEKNGTIPCNALDEVLKALNKDVSNDEIKEMLTEVDFEQKGVIEFEEFMLLMNKKAKEFDDDARIIEAFKVFEKENKKGFIEMTDFKNLLMYVGKSEEETDALLTQAEIDIDGFINYEAFIRKLSACV